MKHPLLTRTRGGHLHRDGIDVDDGFALLQTICERFPCRVVGSADEHGQAEYLAGVLRAAGLDPVSIDSVPCLSCDFAPPQLRLGTAAGRPLPALPVCFSGSTPPNGVTADLVYFDDIEFVDFGDPGLRGKCLLVFGWFGDYSTTAYYRAAVAAGLAGVIVVRNSEQTICYGLPPAAAGCGDLPVLSISHPAAMELMQSGATRVYLQVLQQIHDAFGSNVVACLPADEEKLDDRTFLVTAHLDAKPVRPAAADNAAGTAMAVAVMQTLARTRRRRDLWFVGYTDEEHGFSGSRHFAQHHRELVAQAQCQFYYDGYGTIVGCNQLTVTGDDDLAQFVQGIAAEICLPGKLERRTNTLDPVVLFADGIPAVQLTRNPQRTWHTNADLPEDLAPTALYNGIHLYAEMLYRLVSSPTLPFRCAVDAGARKAGEAKCRNSAPASLTAARSGTTDAGKGGKSP